MFTPTLLHISNFIFKSTNFLGLRIISKILLLLLFLNIIWIVLNIQNWIFLWLQTCHISNFIWKKTNFCSTWNNFKNFIIYFPYIIWIVLDNQNCIFLTTKILYFQFFYMKKHKFSYTLFKNIKNAIINIKRYF